MIVASLVVICVLVGLLFGYQHRVQTAESIEFLESGVILRVTPDLPLGPIPPKMRESEVIVS
jgi:hypothetical protein